MLASAILASTASAEVISYDKYPATAEGNLTTNTSIIVSGTEISCSGGGLFGVAAQRPSDTLVAPLFAPSGCIRTIGMEKVNTQIKLNGCNLRFHPAPSNKIDVYPPNCGPIEIVEGTYCTRYIDPQSGLTNYGAISNEKVSGQDGLRVEMSASIPYRIKGKNWFCQEGKLTWSSTWLVDAHGIGGEPLGMRLTQPVGMFMSGKASESEASQPRFDFASSPSYVSIRQTPESPHTLAFQGRTLQCDYANWEAGATGPTNSLSLTAAYEYCDANVLGNTVLAVINMNNCSYQLRALNAGPPYSGAVDVSCAKAGEGIEAKLYANAESLKANTPLCVYKIGAQSGLGSVSFTNGEGEINAGLNLTGIAYSRLTGNVLTCGAISANATYSGGSLLHGLQ